MITTAQIKIKQPAEKVWQLMRDEKQLPLWLTNFKSIEHLSGEKGEAGSTSRMVFLEGGRTMEITEHILKVVENKEVHFTLSHPTMISDVRTRLVQKDGGTMLIQATETKPQGFFMKLFFLFMKGTMKKRMQTDLERLKLLAEK
jgi:uncharacterized protein YndB with AHSA1/START domain